MKKRRRTIFTQIWSLLLGLMITFVVILILLNTYFIKQYQVNYVYDKMEELKLLREEAIDNNEISDDAFLRNYGSDIHWFILSGDEGDFSILYTQKNRHETTVKQGETDTDKLLAQSIWNEIMTYEGNLETDPLKASIDVANETLYAYIVELDDDMYWVMSATVKYEPIFSRTYFIAFLLVLGIGSFLSWLVSRKFSKELKGIESYSEEIANHQWNEPAPSSKIEEFDQLSHALERMKNQLERSETREREFIQSSSHNMKTPIMIIKGYAQAMLDGVHISNSEKPEETILNEANRVEKRINQMIQLYSLKHINEQKQGMEIIRIDRVIQRLVSRFDTVDDKIEWKANLFEKEILGQLDSLISAIENILDNQIRYAKNIVSINMENVLINDRQFLRISIYNDGEQIEASDPNIIFERYHKANDGKTGLGLAIAKEVFESHKGSVGVRNVQNGVVFQLDLPSQ